MDITADMTQCKEDCKVSNEALSPLIMVLMVGKTGRDEVTKGRDDNVAK
jgi:hypothetical protein